ncbi:MAG: hypothetical protein JWO31_1617, partial [Phycisphaerales bacterium]|nr:hypothetical protein [Phycisphaerales bacterium]
MNDSGGRAGRCAAAGGGGGYTLVEMLTTVAVLVIVLGLMVSLARHVRERSAQALTKALLRQLDGLMTRYADRHDGALPIAPAFPPPDVVAAAAGPGGLTVDPAVVLPVPPEPARVDRALLLRAARANSQAFVTALTADPPAPASFPPSPQPPPGPPAGGGG